MHNAVEVKSDERKDDLFTPDEMLMLKVFVPGIYKSVCLRYFGTSLWGLTSNIGLNRKVSGNVQQGIALFHLQIQSLVFSALSVAFLSVQENVNSALITVQLRKWLY